MRNPEVLAAMRAVPRHLFVPLRFRSAAYDDRRLPIGLWPDHLPARHRRCDDRIAGTASRPSRAGGRYRVGLPGGTALAPGEAGIYDRNHRDARTGRGSTPVYPVRCSSYGLLTWVSLRGCLSLPARSAPSHNGDLTKRLERLLRSSLTSSLLVS